MAPKPVTYKPWHPATYEVADAVAAQAFMRGEADKAQQKRALDWIIGQAARTHDLHYFPDNAHDTDFALGKAFVGQQIIKMLKLNTLKLTKKDNDNG